MNLLRLSRFGVKEVYAVKYSYKGKEVYNIKHGDKHVLSLGVSNKTIANDFKDAREVLVGDSYILKPITYNGNHIKDKENNSLYYLDIDDNMNHMKHSIIFIECDISNVVINGDFDVIGYGVCDTGKQCKCILARNKVIVSWEDSNRIAKVVNGEIEFTTI